MYVPLTLCDSVEVVIDLEVDLLAGKIVRRGSSPIVVELENAFVAILFAANPSIAGGIQAVADLVVVRRAALRPVTSLRNPVESTARPVRVPGSALYAERPNSRAASGTSASRPKTL